ncbi:MAG: sensor histidine kinase [Bacteroidota bacterium]
MKLLNHTLAYLSGSLLIVIGIWAVVFYFNMLDEVYDSIDDGLDNYKMLIIQKAQNDSTILHKSDFAESNYFIREIPEKQAVRIHEHYQDTLMYMQNEEDFEPVRLLTTVFSHQGHYYELHIISSMVEEDDLVEDLLYSLIFLYLAIVMSILLINNFLLKKIWKPFYQLIARLKRFNLKHATSFEPPETKVVEFQSLNETILGMLNQNIEIYNSQKQFIENASHELQTPLAVCINKIELMLEENHLSEKQTQSLQEIIQNIQRLTRLNKSLLLLSKIENKQFTENETIDFNALCKQLIQDFSELLTFKDIHLELKENGTFHHRMNRDLAVILLSNLIKNAITHNSAEKFIRIYMDEQSFSISNSGQLLPLDPERIFTRFYKASEKNSSTGLGLSIIKAITEHYHLSVNYMYDGVHTIHLSH